MERLGGRVPLEKMIHDELNRAFVDMMGFAAVGEVGSAGQGLVDGRHLEGRKIKHVRMPGCEFISGRPQGALGVAAGADDIQVRAEGRP